MMKKNILLAPLLILLTAWLTILPCTAMAGEDPVQMLNSVANKMISELKSHKATLKSNPSLVLSLTNRIVVPHANLDAMSQRVLPPQTWRKATSNQRASFKTEFTRILERTYASALANYANETVRFYPVRGGAKGKSTLTVSSEIVRTDGPSIKVNYRLVSSGSQWKLYDMTVEGVSMLESFRSQFSDKLSRGNIEELIATLRNHNSGRG